MKSKRRSYQTNFAKPTSTVPPMAEVEKDHSPSDFPAKQSLPVYAVYLCSLWTLGLVVAVMEDNFSEIKAISEANELMKGKEVNGFVLMVLMILAGGAIYMAFRFCFQLQKTGAATTDENASKTGNAFAIGIPKKQFLEVNCKRSRQIRRFAFGTEAGFAVNFINKKSEANGDSGIPLASYVEAVKEGEVPVIFGPNAPLVDYGPGWKLHTVNDSEVSGAKGINVATRRVHRVKKDSNSLQKESQSAISLFYIGKILLAFLLIFIVGAIFTLFLENLPQLILYLNSSSVHHGEKWQKFLEVGFGNETYGEKWQKLTKSLQAARQRGFQSPNLDLACFG